MAYSRAVVGVALVTTVAAAWFVVREQRAANRQILSTLDEVKSALSDQARRSRELEQLDAIALAPLVKSPKPQAPSPALIEIETLPITWATDWSSYQPAGIIAPAAPIVLERKLTDPAFIKRLYVGYAVLQASDVITTTVALKRGAREGNPLIRDFADSPAAMIDAKPAAGVVTIIAIERLRKTHPVVASINATLAAVIVNNIAVAARTPQN